jgi:exosortase
MLAWLRFIFNEPTQDMSHGWVVPLFSLFLVWRRRREIAAAAGPPSLAGVLLCLPLLALLWLGERGDQPRVSQVAVYGLLWALVYACFGRGLARLLFFPVAFLVFTVPLGFLDFFTVRLRLATAWISAFLLNGGGIPVVRVGTGLHCLAGEGFALDVADPCSGLRSICALTAITAAYAYLTLRTRWKQWLLFACSVPLAMLGNMVRIFTITLIAQYFGQRVGTGFYHDYSGYLVFVVGTLMMMQVGAWIGRLGGPEPEAAATVSTPSAVPASGTRGAWAGLALVTLTMAGMYTALQRLPPPELEPQAFLAARLPELPGYRLAKPWHCQNEQCRRVFDNLPADPSTGKPPVCPACGGVMDEISYGERAYLPADTLFLKGNYYDAFGDRLHVSVVVNGASRRSIHRPELCLPAQGFSIERIRNHELPDGNGGRLSVKMVDLRPSLAGQQQRAGQVYFFISAHHQTASHYVRILISIRDRAIFNRVTRWAMVAIVGDPPFSSPERLDAVQSFLGQLNAALRDPAARAATVSGTERTR